MPRTLAEILAGIEQPKSKNIMRRFTLDEISAVDSPAQQPARVLIMKRDGEPRGTRISKQMMREIIKAGDRRAVEKQVGSKKTALVSPTTSLSPEEKRIQKMKPMEKIVAIATKVCAQSTDFEEAAKAVGSRGFEQALLEHAKVDGSRHDDASSVVLYEARRLAKMLEGSVAHVQDSYNARKRQVEKYIRGSVKPGEPMAACADRLMNDDPAFAFVMDAARSMPR